MMNKKCLNLPGSTVSLIYTIASSQLFSGFDVVSSIMIFVKRESLRKTSFGKSILFGYIHTFLKKKYAKKG